MHGDGLKFTGCGEALRIVRKERGMSLRDVSKKLNWNASKLSKYENNTVGVFQEVLDQIAIAIGVLPEYLAFKCLEVRYAKFADPATPVGQAFNEMLQEFNTKSEFTALESLGFHNTAR